VIDLSREVVCGELVRLSQSAGIAVDAQMLPAQLTTSSLLTGLSPQELVDAVVESMHGGTPEAARAERSMDDRILSKVCEALSETISLGRIAAALRVLMGEPEDSDLLTREERRRIGGELFTVDYRRQAHANISRMESYIHPLEGLGTRPENSEPGFLTCIALEGVPAHIGPPAGGDPLAGERLRGRLDRPRLDHRARDVRTPHRPPTGQGGHLLPRDRDPNSTRRCTIRRPRCSRASRMRRHSAARSGSVASNR
jgi:hypothetical protein